MPRRPFKTFLLTLLLAALPLTSWSQDKAQLPYSMISSYLELFKSLEHLELIIPSMMIVSTNPQVAPQAIEFKVSSPAGWQAFSPDANGVIQFPDQPDWMNLVMISNQPKGTLQLGVAYAARPLKSASMPYQELMSLVPQFEEALTALAEQQGKPPSKVTGLTIQMPENSSAAVHVHSQKGEKTLKSYASGVVVIKYDQTLWEENPQVEFDAIPIGIVPLL